MLDSNMHLVELNDDASRILYIPLQKIIKEQQTSLNTANSRVADLEAKYQQCIEHATNQNKLMENYNVYDSPYLAGIAVLAFILILKFINKLKYLKIGSVEIIEKQSKK